jgi:hypothetical protein
VASAHPRDIAFNRNRDGWNAINAGASWYWDRASTAAAYHFQSTRRRVQYPESLEQDLFEGTILLEVLVAQYQITVHDAELFSGDRCGVRAECFTSATTPTIVGGVNDGDSAIITLGHTVLFPSDGMPSVPKIRHEVDGHVMQYEDWGAFDFGGAYGSEWLVRSLLGDENAYDNLSFERDAKSKEPAG